MCSKRVIITGSRNHEPDARVVASRSWLWTWGVAIFCALSTSASFAQTVDRIRKLDRTEVVGEIAGMSPDAVSIAKSGSGEQESVPVELIRDVMFGDEPDALRSARAMLQRQDAAGALSELEKLGEADLNGVSDAVQTDVDFVRAGGAALRAMATGQGADAAVKGLQTFLTKHSRSYHTYRVQELLGDLLGSGGKFDEAAKAYAALEKGPPAYRVRAACAKAGLLFEQGKFAEADREYGNALKVETTAEDEASAAQKREADLGRARCLARQGQADAAVAKIDAVVQTADPEDIETLAKAYNALGDAHLAGGRDQDALIAFLTVDLVYGTFPDSHAEALYNLVQLWEKAKNPERSREARQLLEATYPESPWTRRLAAGAKAS
jgi:tetratricopeptide (TPR) repeat protein